MTRIGRVAGALVTVATLLSLSACGTSAPAAVGSYRATFVGKHASPTFPLVLAADGRFVLQLGPDGTPFRGVWSQTGDRVTMTGKVGITKVVLQAIETGAKLNQGSYASFGRLKSQQFALPWTAVRT
jgi:hypothetical protein